jgi:predicted RNA-binding protein with PUA-like domain
MANHYLLKTEASAYSFEDLQRDGATVWDGVSNPVALRNLREMQPGEARDLRNGRPQNRSRHRDRRLG